MQCIFKTLVVSPRLTQAFCEDNSSHMCVLKVCLAFTLGMSGVAPLWLPEVSLPVWNFMFSEVAQEPNGGGFTSHYVQHWVWGPKGWHIMAHLPIVLSTLHAPALLPAPTFIPNLSSSFPAALRLYFQKTSKINIQSKTKND